jgi:hypothetical protein
MAGIAHCLCAQYAGRTYECGRRRTGLILLRNRWRSTTGLIVSPPTEAECSTACGSTRASARTFRCSVTSSEHICFPSSFRHGARLIGRWETDDGRVVAVWEYDDRAAYERIEAAVRADPDSEKARQQRARLPPLINTQHEVFMTSTVGPHAARPEKCS